MDATTQFNPIRPTNTLQKTLYILERNNLKYTIYGQGDFFFAFWENGDDTTHFVKHENIIDYTISITHYIEAEKRGECTLLFFDPSGDVGGLGEESSELPTMLGDTVYDPSEATFDNVRSGMLNNTVLGSTRLSKIVE